MNRIVRVSASTQLAQIRMKKERCERNLPEKNVHIIHLQKTTKNVMLYFNRCSVTGRIILSSSSNECNFLLYMFFMRLSVTVQLAHASFLFCKGYLRYNLYRRFLSEVALSRNLDALGGTTNTEMKSKGLAFSNE